MQDMYVVTHPHAERTAQGVVGGWFDSRLAPGGREDAGRVAITHLRLDDYRGNRSVVALADTWQLGSWRSILRQGVSSLRRM
ncbi:hypothetical protein [Nocardia wallacei]|uniref:hypothetical protein n=1 Tax=Nocardia wallacei TaxID=480035 RepID=UPI0024576B2D|nr:hypothetical protein [Nocardia wallacei]